MFRTGIASLHMNDTIGQVRSLTRVTDTIPGLAALERVITECRKIIARHVLPNNSWKRY